MAPAIILHRITDHIPQRRRDLNAPTIPTQTRAVSNTPRMQRKSLYLCMYDVTAIYSNITSSYDASAMYSNIMPWPVTSWWIHVRCCYGEQYLM